MSQQKQGRVKYAAAIILAGVAAGEGIIAFPDKPRELWRTYSAAPERAKEYLKDLAAQRRKAFAAGDVEAALRATAPRE
ncbi:hypothetical protein H7I53_03340 [Mycolicibacterium pulveris]|uniref:hypothetical protein n=1 Tax=Mycolicibacterium pulveris TaxID=36813 RepID=UPI0013D69B71|nr:hypothetical protein [Mycolicibacterium pulveris]MCV6979261.1 hypothetical protein [Mycolicibacterium pulveris]